MTIKSELLALSKKRKKLSTTFVVEWAQANRASALHSALEWDDKVAGQRYREWQVRQLIGIYVFDDSGDRSLISLSIDRGAGGYRSVDDIAASPDLMMVMAEDARLELLRVRAKYGRVKELIEIWSTIDKVAGRKAAAE